MISNIMLFKRETERERVIESDNNLFKNIQLVYNKYKLPRHHHLHLCLLQVVQTPFLSIGYYTNSIGYYTNSKYYCLNQK